jgi:hypothetical protein
MKNINKDYSHIKGWGIDADPDNDPTYPMKNRRELEPEGYDWQRPAQQPATIQVFRSIERPNLSAVFGTSTPPTGLSGVIRRFAYKYSESSYAHWLPLLLADRINVIEGVIDDLMHFRIPNTFAEKGGKALWKFNRKAILLNALAGISLSTTIAGFIFRKRTAKAFGF